MKSRNPSVQILLTLLVIGVSLFSGISQEITCQFQCWCWFSLFGLSLMLAFGVLFVTRIRWVEAGAEKLHLLRIRNGERQSIDYQKIKWIFELRNHRGLSYICLKYFDQKRLKNRIIFFIPKRNEFFRFRESDLTTFIRDKAIQVNPAYSKNEEPESWMIYIVIFLVFIITAIPILLFCN